MIIAGKLSPSDMQYSIKPTPKVQHVLLLKPVDMRNNTLELYWHVLLITLNIFFSSKKSHFQIKRKNLPFIFRPMEKVRFDERVRNKIVDS